MAVRRREPEVLVFQDTVVKRPPKQFKKSKDPLPQHTDVYVNQKQEIEQNGLDFRETMNEMRLLTAKSLAHKDKKGEKDLLLSLGAKAPPRTKIPYTRLLNSIKKRRKNTATTEITVNSDDKGFDGKEKERKRTTIKRGKGRWRDDIKSLAPLPHTFKKHPSMNSTRFTKTKI